MINKTYILTKKEISKLVKEIILELNKYQFILLNGNIGVGKTFLVKEIAKQLGELSTVTSPSFGIMNIYNDFIHIDAYNLKGGLEQYYDFFDNKIVIIEWSSNLNLVFDQYLEINIDFISNDKRMYKISGVS